jgi:3-deoxy-D-manno-octulosonate 8-phosphate phosphatase (KDO 8-P phosphatase)
MDISKLSNDLILRASKIKLLLMDCDGVLTDGRLYYGNTGEILKVFNVKDGQGITDWHNAGFQSGIISGRKSKALEQRVNELGVRFLFDGSVDKIADYEKILEITGFTDHEVAYIGDDIPDIPLLKRVGLRISVNDANIDVKRQTHIITDANGGFGAVRECIQIILMTKSKCLLDNDSKI